MRESKESSYRGFPSRKTLYILTGQKLGWGCIAEAVIAAGRYQSHRRGYGEEFGLFRLFDSIRRDYMSFKFQGTVEEATKAFSSKEFAKDVEMIVNGKEYIVPESFGEWGSFCKTQYANQYGIKNFLRAHLGVVAMLDKLKELGFIIHVSDEGDFWQKRDIKALVEEIGSWDAMIAAFFGAMKDSLPEGMTLEAPIADRPDFEHLEMKGQGKIVDFLKAMRSANDIVPSVETN